jgi:hypothetical protein
MAFKPIPVQERGLLKPAEIAALCRVFDEACKMRNALPDSEEAKEIALTLLALRNAGMVSEDALREAVAFRRIDQHSA